MAQYIDKSTIKEWLEKRKISFKKDIDDGVYPTYLCALMDFEDFVDTLEVKKVDLEQELDYDDYLTFFKEHPDYNDKDWGFEETWTFAQYCYKLGLKAQKL